MSLQVTHLSVEKSRKPILADLSFTAPAGAVTGLIGPNGAGKSTLLTALLGLIPSRGTASFHAADLPNMPRRGRARLLAYVEQSTTTEERLSVRDVVALGRIPFEAAWQAEPSAEDESIIATALADTEMTGFADRRFSTLSGGEQQRVHVARALAQQPELLLLDEPTSHLDIRAQLQLLALLRLKAASGMTVLLALHDLNLAARYCDHLVVMNHGKVVTEGTPTDVLTPALLHNVYGVRARVLKSMASSPINIVFDDAAPINPD